jgi:hypothetical protein
MNKKEKTLDNVDYSIDSICWKAPSMLKVLVYVSERAYPIMLWKSLQSIRIFTIAGSVPQVVRVEYGMSLEIVRHEVRKRYSVPGGTAAFPVARGCEHVGSAAVAEAELVSCHSSELTLDVDPPRRIHEAYLVAA